MRWLKKNKRKEEIYVVIDTNVIVSAFWSLNKITNPSILIDAFYKGKVVVLYNENILLEYLTVLNREKFKFSKEQIDIFSNAIKILGIHTKAVNIGTENFPDPKDLVFYEVKMSKEDSYLVTGNMKHFPQEPKIVTPAEMVQILKEKGLLDEF